MLTSAIGCAKGGSHVCLSGAMLSVLTSSEVDADHLPEGSLSTAFADDPTALPQRGTGV